MVLGLELELASDGCVEWSGEKQSKVWPGGRQVCPFARLLAATIDTSTQQSAAAARVATLASE